MTHLEGCATNNTVVHVGEDTLQIKIDLSHEGEGHLSKWERDALQRFISLRVHLGTQSRKGGYSSLKLCGVPLP